MSQDGGGSPMISLFASKLPAIRSFPGQHWTRHCTSPPYSPPGFSNLHCHPELHSSATNAPPPVICGIEDPVRLPSNAALPIFATVVGGTTKLWHAPQNRPRQSGMIVADLLRHPLQRSSARLND
eukprot:gene8677-biopygen6951